MQETTGLVFPCRFPIKIVGKNAESLTKLVQEIVSQHTTSEELLDWQQRLSKADTYFAITVTIQAHSQIQLDNLYRALSSAEGVIMVL